MNERERPQPEINSPTDHGHDEPGRDARENEDRLPVIDEASFLRALNRPDIEATLARGRSLRQRRGF